MSPRKNSPSNLNPIKFVELYIQYIFSNTYYIVTVTFGAPPQHDLAACVSWPDGKFEHSSLLTSIFFFNQRKHYTAGLLMCDIVAQSVKASGTSKVQTTASIRYFVQFNSPWKRAE